MSEVFQWSRRELGPDPDHPEPVVLRAFQESDVEAYLAGCNDPEAQRWLPLPVPYSRELAVAWCTGGAERLRLDGEGLHLAVSTADDELLGDVSLKRTQWGEGITEVGYWLLPGARGRGIATRACRELSVWALSDERFFRVELTVSPGNDASQRVAVKAGFSYEGTARSGGFVPTGRTDLRVYSLIREDLRQS